MKAIYIIICLLLCLDGYSQCNNYYELCQDTLDIGNMRIYLQAPSISIKKSQIFDFNGEGIGYYFPLPDNDLLIPGLFIEDVVNTQYSMLNTKDFDVELWNTLNRNLVGSRCFIKNGLYNRIDRFYGGLVIYYENIPKHKKDLANMIIQSIYIKTKYLNDPPLNESKRRKEIVK